MHVIWLLTLMAMVMFTEKDILNGRQKAKWKGDHGTDPEPLGGLRQLFCLIVVVLAPLSCEAGLELC